MQSQTQKFWENIITVRRKPGLPNPHFREANSKGVGIPWTDQGALGSADKMCAAWNRENGSIYGSMDPCMDLCINKHTHKHTHIDTHCACVLLEYTCSCFPYTCTTRFEWYYITEPLSANFQVSLNDIYWRPFYIIHRSTSIFQLLHI